MAQQTDAPATTRDRTALLGIAAALVLARVVWGVVAWDPGWSAIAWDDFAKVEIAQAWARHPTLSPDQIWLPLPFWVLGSAFLVLGGSFATSPLALVAIVNTAALIGSAIVIGLAAKSLFRSSSGGLIAFTAVLFSPWGYFTSLSALIEPLYYLAIAVAAWMYVTWLQRRTLSSLIWGGVAVGAAAAIRYEAWWLAAAWGVVIATPELVKAFGREERPSVTVVATAAIPASVPVAWIALNAIRTGDPFHFVAREIDAYAGGYGTELFDTVFERLTLYPFAMVRSAPLLVAVLLVLLAWHRRTPDVWRLAFLFGLAFTGFYASTVLAPPVGIFTERYMFAFVLGTAPILGGAPAMLRSLRDDRTRRLITTAVAILAVVVTVYRINDRPVEWTHAPDLLTLNSALGEAAATGGPLRVGIGPGMDIDAIPLEVQNGSNVVVIRGDGDAGPAAIPPDVDIWIERLPDRVRGYAASIVVGRYQLFGPGAGAVASLEPMTGGDRWTYHDERGDVADVSPSPYVGLEFAGDDPLPGAEASVRRLIPHGTTERTDSIEVRSLYGHGYSAGRITMEVRLDGVVLHAHDIATRSRWVTVPLAIPAGDGASTLEVAVVAEPAIETGWGWGRASTVLIRSLRTEGAD